MGKNLYVGNLSFSINDGKLQEVFSQAGAVKSAKVITDKLSGKSRGFGFVEMDTDDGAQKAIQQFNGTELDGRKLLVNEAKPKESKGSGGGGRFN